MTADRDHDWAALVAYATVSDNFDDQVYNFFQRQTHRAIDVSLARADDLAASPDGEDKSRDTERERQLDLAREGLARWEARLPDGSGEEDRTRRAQCYGIHGSVFKRIALLRKSRRTDDPRVTALLAQALAYYRKAMDEWASAEQKHHWVATQALSLGAVLKAKPEPATFNLARELATRDLARDSAEAQAWAHATLAELEMLGPYHTSGTVSATPKTVVDHCTSIVNLMGPASFPVESTRRQFQRYLDAWQDATWEAIARAAVEALTPTA